MAKTWHETYNVRTDDLRAAITYAKEHAATKHPLTQRGDLQTPIVKRRKRFITVEVWGRDTE